MLTPHRGHPLDALRGAVTADAGVLRGAVAVRDAAGRGLAEGVVLGVVGSGLGVAPRAAVVGTTGRTVARAVGRAVACVIGRALRTPGGAVAAGNPGTSPFPSTGMAGSGPVTLDEFATRRTTPT